MSAIAPKCDAQGYMFRAAFMKRVPLFLRDFLENVGLCIVAAGVETTAKRFTDRIAVRWRKVLTERVHRKYFSNMVRPACPPFGMAIACVTEA